jgi:hypothetical protein
MIVYKLNSLKCQYVKIIKIEDLVVENEPISTALTSTSHLFLFTDFVLGIPLKICKETLRLR